LACVFVRLDDFLHERVAHDVFFAQVDEARLSMFAQAWTASMMRCGCWAKSTWVMRRFDDDLGAWAMRVKNIFIWATVVFWP